MILISLVLLAGCGHYQWVRTRPGPADLAVDRYYCQRDSLAAAPVNQVIEIERERQHHHTTETVSAVDLNADSRSDLFFNCMAARGWVQQFISDDAPRPVAAVPTAPQAPYTPPPPPGAPPPPPNAPPRGALSAGLPPPPTLSAANQNGFRDYLASQKLHKAFAVGGDGSYGWRTGKASREEAADAALEACAQYASDCRVYAIDNQLARD